jgi:hypothetical protein
MPRSAANGAARVRLSATTAITVMLTSSTRTADASGRLPPVCRPKRWVARPISAMPIRITTTPATSLGSTSRNRCMEKVRTMHATPVRMSIAPAAPNERPASPVTE